MTGPVSAGLPALRFSQHGTGFQGSGFDCGVSVTTSYAGTVEPVVVLGDVRLGFEPAGFA